jgi:hypothetical protein
MFHTPWPTWFAWFAAPIATIVMFIVIWLVEIRRDKETDES